MSTHTRAVRRLGLPLLVAGAAGCSSPFGPIDSDYGKRAPIERLRTIERLELEKFATRVPLPEKPADGTLARPPSRFEGMESLDVALGEVRAATLENNLDLRVVLVDPVTAGEALREEEAKFEAVFRPSFQFREDDNPTLDVTESNQRDSYSFGAGVDIPLRSGGRASVDFTEFAQETDNPFITLNTSYSPDVTFSLSQPLLRNAGRETNTHSIRIAAYQEQITQAQTKLEVIRQLAAADRAYWGLYAARRALDVTQQQYDLANEQLEKSKRLVAQGAAAEVEVIRAQAGVAERLESIIVAENAVLQRQRDLKRLMNTPGLDIDTKVMIRTATEPSPQPYELDGTSLAEVGVNNRMEMLELELQLAADLSTIDFAKNQALPLITLDYQYSIAGLGGTLQDAHGVLWRNNFESWFVGVSGQVPIGNEGAKARVQQAILSRLQRLSTKDARRLAIRQEVLDAVDSVQSSWQRILAARQSAIAAGRTLEAERRQFELGARTSTDVLDAATRLAEGQLAEIRALADYQIALVDLSFATGTLLGAARVDWSPRDPRTENVAELELPDAAAPVLLEPGVEPVVGPRED
jgi:outer membrane protein